MPLQPRSLSWVVLALFVLLAIVCGLPLVRSAAVAAAHTAPAIQDVTREERTVRVGDVRERWRLVWTSPPKPACTPDDGDELGWFTCPCSGFAFGEHGDLDLVRVTPDGREDRLPLTPVFDVEFNPGSQAVLPRWPERDADINAVDKEPVERFAARIRRRAEVEIMQLHDVDHDGRSTEFFLQVAAAPCGKRMGIVVGVSRDRPMLHVFGSAANPETPLILRVDHWLALARSSRPAPRIDWRCGDHGTSEEEELVLRADGRAIHVTRNFYQCGPTGARGAFVRSDEE